MPLICELTDSERRDYGIQLATTLGDIYSLEVEKKRMNDSLKDRMGGLQAKADSLRTLVETGQEFREVECETRLGVPDDKHKQIVRIDTGEVVSTEEMTDDDKQLDMQFENVPSEPEEEFDDGEEDF